MPICIAAVVSLLALPSTALAYIDAGTGSMLAQGLIGALAVAAAYFRRIRAALRAMFRRRADDTPPAGP
jgi:uncharacterized BrkB/YihY/UPF0761 family membrane protein